MGGRGEGRGTVGGPGGGSLGPCDTVKGLRSVISSVELVNRSSLQKKQLSVMPAFYFTRVLIGGKCTCNFMKKTFAP